MEDVCMSRDWERKVVAPHVVLSKIEPGMCIFLSSGVSEPRTLIKELIASDQRNLRDLELIQPVSLGDAIPRDDTHAQKYRLKTFFSGKAVRDALSTGWADLLPNMFSQISRLIRSGAIIINAAFIQITPPDEKGFCSLGVTIDVTRDILDSAALVVGEINDRIPRTFGDTAVHVDNFHYFVRSAEDPIYLYRPPVDDIFDRVAAHVASVIEDGSCLSFFVGNLFEALAKHLSLKKDLGIHSLVLTDPVMDIIKSGAVTNRNKGMFKGKTAVSYAEGTPELMRWLDGNPLIEFHGIDIIASPQNIGRNDRFVVMRNARKVDITGNVALHVGKGNIVAGAPGILRDFATGASLSRGGQLIFALPSRNLKGGSNILTSINKYPNQFAASETLDVVATEYGVAHLTGRSVRERALALIDIAHPDDRDRLVEEAKEANILDRDQTYIKESGYFYPGDIACTHTFKGGLTIHFRAIKPSDVGDMRRLFYRFSEEAIYFRYFRRIKMMPRFRMQAYVNIDYRKIMSIVGVVEKEGIERIIAEGRYVRGDDPYADIAFFVDEGYMGKGVASFLFELLIKTAQKQNIRGFRAEVLTENKAVLNLFKKFPYPLKSTFRGEFLTLLMSFTDDAPID